MIAEWRRSYVTATKKSAKLSWFDAARASGIKQIADGGLNLRLFFLQVVNLFLYRGRIVLPSVALQPSCIFRITLAEAFQLQKLAINEGEIGLQFLELLP